MSLVRLRASRYGATAYARNCSQMTWPAHAPAEPELAEGERKLVEAAGVEPAKWLFGKLLMVHEFWLKPFDNSSFRRFSHSTGVVACRRGST